MKRRPSIPLSFLLFFLLSCGPGMSMPAQELNQLDLSRVVLYSSGVGYFEQSGTVTGNANLRLTFQAEQLNDVLKSLVVRDLDGGSISSVVYPGQDPIERTLGSFALDLSGNPDLASILGQLRGVSLRIGRGGSQESQGKLVGVESYYPPSEGNLRPSPKYRINLLTSRGLESLELEGASFLALEDPRLNSELQAALEVLAGQTAEQGRPVSIMFTGTGRRRVSLSYVAEAPVWKTSYRLDFGDGTLGKGLLQAWAIVENTSDTDWENIQLSLVSGSPVSFIQDLVTPIYVDRPRIASSAADIVAPSTYDSASPVEAPSAARSLAPAPSSAFGFSAMAEMEAKQADANILGSGVEASASSARAGELYSFSIQGLVSIPRRQSGMIPLVVQSIPVEPISIYSGNENSVHPMAGLRIVNESGSRLPAGPMTVYGSGIYAGDALIESLGAGEERILSYARDLDLRVSEDWDQDRHISSFSINRGVLIVSRRVESRREFEVSNTSDRGKKLLIEHPKSSRSLEPGMAPEESSAELFRFGLDVPARSTRTLEIRESEIVSESISLLASRSATYLNYLTEGAMTPAQRQALQRAAELRQALDAFDGKISDLNRARSTAVSDQARVRSNLEVVGRDSSQGQIFLERLLELENQILSLDRDVETARKDQAEARTQFEAYINNLNL